MLCNLCFSKESVIYLDCYCIFCLDCYEAKVQQKIEDASKMTSNNGKSGCPFCGRPTTFKKCDRRNAQEAATIKQLASKPELASLKALETTKFNCLQNKKFTDHLVKKADFLEKVIDYFIRRYAIINFEFPPELLQEDQFGFNERLHQQHRTFSLEQLRTNQNLISCPDFTQLEENSVRDNKIYRGETTGLLEEQPPNRQTPNPMHEQRMRFNIPPQSVAMAFPPKVQKTSFINQDQKSINQTFDSSTKNIMGFQLQNLRQSNARKESSNPRNKHKLQTLLLETSNFTTPILNKRSGNYFVNKKL